MLLHTYADNFHPRCDLTCLAYIAVIRGPSSFLITPLMLPSKFA